MSIIKILLYPVIFVFYLCIYYLGNHELRLALSIVLCIITSGLGVYILCLLFKHENTKEYFWNNLTDDDKELVNYGFHRSAFAESGSSYHPFSWYWKKEVAFQEERNVAIIQCDEEKGNLLISLEKLLCNLEILIFFLLVITVLSFDYA